MAHVEDTWAQRELPILRAAYRRVESGEHPAALANADPPYIER